MGTTPNQGRRRRTPHAGDKLLTIAEVADAVRVPIATLRGWSDLGSGPHSSRPACATGQRSHHLAKES